MPRRPTAEPPTRSPFLRELARFGPRRLRQPVTVAEARSYCRHLALSHYENFVVGSLLLPRQLLRHFHSVYAYCRWADDLADETEGGDQTLELLDWWQDELHACYAGRPRHPVMIALAETIKQFAIPEAPFLDLLDAFVQDQLVKRYETYAQLLDYCRHSANPVGRLVLYLFRCHDSINGALSDHICTALQLANFWQDLDRDLAIGRVYLPAEDCRQFGYADEDLAARRCTPAFVELLRYQVERTRQMFRQGMPLIERVPPAFRVDVDLFIRGGLGILNAIEAQGFDVWRRRPTLGKCTQARLLLRAVWTRWTASGRRRCRT
jgi:squalene synthase HpnC